MDKEFVSYEQAVALKELGFDEECLAWHNSKRLLIDNYDNYNSKMPFEYCCSIPLKQQVFRWFREKYGLIGWVEGKRVYRWCIESPMPADGQLNFSPFKTYEEAENACIDKLIELAKQQDK